jgi:hypothetical protein
VIDRSTTRDTPIDPMALDLVALLFGTHAARTILASVHVRTHQQAGHMDASDLIKALQNHLARRGPSTYESRPHMPPRTTCISSCRSVFSPMANVRDTVQNLGGESSGYAIASWIPVSSAPPGRASTPQVLDGLL